MSPDSRCLISVSGNPKGCLRVWDLEGGKALLDAFPNEYVVGMGFFTDSEFGINRNIHEWLRLDTVTGACSELEPRPGRIRRSAILHPSGTLLKGVIDTYGVGESSGVSGPLGLFTYHVTPAGLVPHGPPKPQFVSLCAYNAAGTMYVALTKAGGLSVYDAATDEPLQHLPVRDDWMVYLHFSTDSRRLYIPSGAGIESFDFGTQTTNLLRLAKLKPKAVFRTLAVHPGGRILATTDGTPAVTIHDAETLQPLRTYDFKKGNAQCVAFTPDGTRGVVGYGRGPIVVFDLDE